MPIKVQTMASTDDPRTMYTECAEEIGTQLKADGVIVFVEGGDLGDGMGGVVASNRPMADLLRKLIELATAMLEAEPALRRADKETH